MRPGCIRTHGRGIPETALDSFFEPWIAWNVVGVSRRRVTLRLSLRVTLLRLWLGTVSDSRTVSLPNGSGRLPALPTPGRPQTGPLERGLWQPPRHAGGMVATKNYPNGRPK